MTPDTKNPCPVSYCGATISAPCINKAGRPMNQTHPERHRVPDRPGGQPPGRLLSKIANEQPETYGHRISPEDVEKAMKEGNMTAEAFAALNALEGYDDEWDLDEF